MQSPRDRFHGRVLLAGVATGSEIRSFYEDPSTTLRAGAALADIQARLVVQSLTVSHDRGGVVIDFGCGDGFISGIVEAACKTAMAGNPPLVLGVDWAESAVKAAHGSGVRVVRGSLERPGLPLADSSADVVLMSEIIEHVVGTDGPLDEAWRILRPGGTLIVSTPNLAAWYNRLLLLGGIQPVFSEVSLRGVYGRPGHELAGHLRLFTKRALMGLLQAHGFVNVTLSAASYHDIPKPFRPLDRLLCRAPSLASLLVASCTRPGD
jgi:2-polyprenyl-3-methyl-5-hydroxy-6-metoxy-1,4-benzoquinol methylase